MLHHLCPSGESGPYRLKVNGWVVGPDHLKGVSNGGNNGIVVEALEVLPRRLAPLDDGGHAPTMEIVSVFKGWTTRLRMD